jgi:hypothetical protein
MELAAKNSLKNSNSFHHKKSEMLTTLVEEANEAVEIPRSNVSKASSLTHE